MSVASCAVAGAGYDSEGSGDEASKPSNVPEVGVAGFWTAPLKAFFKDSLAMNSQNEPKSQPLSLWSACTGLWSEGAALLVHRCSNRGFATMLVYIWPTDPWWPAGVVPFVPGPVCNVTVEEAAAWKVAASACCGSSP
jgi:hypothetical protein